MAGCIRRSIRRPQRRTIARANGNCRITAIPRERRARCARRVRSCIEANDRPRAATIRPGRRAAERAFISPGFAGNREPRDDARATLMRRARFLAMIARSWLNAVVLGCSMAACAGTPGFADKIKHPTAVFAGLDKITGRIISFEVAIDETVQFGSLQITPRVCFSRPTTEAPQTDVFAEVDEVAADKTYRRIFSGWMFADSPGLHGIEHPVYDIWLTDCKGDGPLIHEAPEVADAPSAAPDADAENGAAVTPAPDAKAPPKKRKPKPAAPPPVIAGPLDLGGAPAPSGRSAP